MLVARDLAGARPSAGMIFAKVVPRKGLHPYAVKGLGMDIGLLFRHRRGGHWTIHMITGQMLVRWLLRRLWRCFGLRGWLLGAPLPSCVRCLLAAHPVRRAAEDSM